MSAGLLLAGLQETGKTSYLALLYAAISTQRAGVVNLGSYQDDREYLNAISERLIRCEEAIHTQVEESRELALSLSIDGRETFLRIPDLSGETWEHALRERRWPRTVAERAAEADGFMLFVHVRAIDVGLTIADATAAAAALGEDLLDEDRPVGGDRCQPTQVSLVDLLQLLSERRRQRPAWASIVLSAWDLAEGSTSPTAWIERNCPLTHQYVTSNERWLRAKIFGVSAQGGNFRDEKARATLQAEDPVDRARIARPDGSPGRVEDPLLWALGTLS